MKRQLSWTLRGTWLPYGTPDVVRPAELAVHAHKGDDGLDLRGHLTLTGWLDRAPVVGTLSWIAGLRPSVRYRLTVAVDPELTLDFTLRPRLSQPIDSVTRLWTEVISARGTEGLLHLRFDIRRDLAPHLLSLLRPSL
ncbi:MAG: hypothetical protein KC502_01010 [Myxococcales bacterium]|nr:hypothetical protein [Myxococcales bacterium]